MREVHIYLLASITLLGGLRAFLLLGLALLEEGLRDKDLVLGRDTPVLSCQSIRACEDMYPRAKKCGTVVCWRSCILR